MIQEPQPGIMELLVYSDFSAVLEMSIFIHSFTAEVIRFYFRSTKYYILFAMMLTMMSVQLYYV